MRGAIADRVEREEESECTWGEKSCTWGDPRRGDMRCFSRIARDVSFCLAMLAIVLSQAPWFPDGGRPNVA